MPYPYPPPPGAPPMAPGEPPTGPPHGAPPGRPPDFHDEISATTASPMVKAAGGLQIGAGLLLALSGAQLMAVATFAKPWVKHIPHAMILLGVATMYLGFKITRTRGWAALGGTVMSGLITLVMGFWVMLTLASGFFSLLATLVPLLSLAGTVLGVLAIGPCLRASEARRKLRESGIDMSF